jgi:murein L,D-transpeptidase YcbB/YkuD
MNSRKTGALRRVFATAPLLLLLALSGACRNREIPPEVGQIIKSTVETQNVPASIRDEKERARAWDEMRRFYNKRQYSPAWITNSGLRPQAEELLQAIDGTVAEGLDPRRYQRERLTSLLKEIEEIRSYDHAEAQRRLAYADMHLTYTYLTLASHVATGRQQPGTLRIDWYTKPRNVDLDSRLEKALADEGGLIESLRTVRPPEEGYKPLVEALNRYREIAKQGGWPTVPEGELKPGAQGPAVAALRARLSAEGDLAGPKEGEAQGAAYDQAVSAAVAAFQKRHGFDPTGVVDADTLAELNVPVDARIQQIQINLERWRWMPSDLGERYIRVNIPEFKMALIEGSQPALEMRVVVGKAQENRTPVFSDKMTYLELNPSWNLPPSIVAEEIIPESGGDPGYLARKGLEVVKGYDDPQTVDPYSVDLAQLGSASSPYRLRQGPGPDNPLGQVKFMFPNEHDIYLHDTPADHLFAKEERAFSHGCIRLERPLELAHVLLKGSEWTPEKVQSVLASGEQTTVSLPKPLPVHLLYFTAWVDESGTLQFRRDVYGHDTKLAKALADEPIVELDFDAVRGQGRTVA